MLSSIDPEKVVLPIHFEDRSGTEFERLCFAYILRIIDWKQIDWYGQVGSDSGRDIWGVREGQQARDTNTCYQCANHQSLRFPKLKEDINKVITGPNGTPDEFVVIVGGRISANMRDKIKTYAKSKGVESCQVWSAPEFEERLRRDTPTLLKRFAEGQAFPETVNELRLFVADTAAANDYEILALMAQCFDRPAFTTPFNLESSIPAFKQAITDTIEVLNTGVHRLRDGTVIRRIPSRHDIQALHIQKSLSKIVDLLADLRYLYDSFLQSGDIRPCGCNDPDCPIFMATPRACHDLDRLRSNILDEFHTIYPEFQVILRWRW